MRRSSSASAVLKTEKMRERGPSRPWTVVESTLLGGDKGTLRLKTAQQCSLASCNNLVKGWLPIDFHRKQLAQAEDELRRQAQQAESKRKLLPEDDPIHVRLVESIFPFKGLIDGTENRGITLKQLHQVVSYAKARCHRWWDTSPPAHSATAGQDLRSSFLNLYHVNSWVIRPATKEKNCSMVELLATAAQLPDYFVSHWWGESVLSSSACLAFAARARSLAEAAAFWICAYANRQHSLGDDISDDPRQTSFYRAMDVADFKVLLILNGGTPHEKPGVAFRRIWCAFEETCCLERADSPLDVVTCRSEGVELITRGLTQAEERLEGERAGSGTAAKVARERSFPEELIKAGLAFDLCRAEASVATDKDHILNSIAGLDLQGTPPDEHPKYTEANERLRSLFALTFFRCALSTASPLRTALASAIRADNLRKHMKLNLAGLKALGDNEMESVIASFPSSVLELTLDMQDTSIGDVSMERLASGLPQNIERLALDFSRCSKISDVGLDLFRRRLQEMESLRRISMNLVGSMVFNGTSFVSLTRLRSWRPLCEEPDGPVWWKPGFPLSCGRALECVRQTRRVGRGRVYEVDCNTNDLLSRFEAAELLARRGALYPGEDQWALVRDNLTEEAAGEEEQDLQGKPAWMQVGDAGAAPGTLWTSSPQPPWHEDAEAGGVSNLVLLLRKTPEYDPHAGESDYGEEF